MEFEEAKERAVRYLVLALRTQREVENKLRKLKVNDEIIFQFSIFQTTLLLLELLLPPRRPPCAP